MDTNTEDTENTNAKTTDLDENLAVEVTPIKDTPSATQQETATEDVEQVEGTEEIAPPTTDMLTDSDVPKNAEEEQEEEGEGEDENSAHKILKPKRRYHLKDALKARFTVGDSKSEVRTPLDTECDEEDFVEEETRNDVRTGSLSRQDSRHTKLFDKDYDEILAHDALADDGEEMYSDSESEGSIHYEKPADTVNLKKQFLINFEEIPDISEISEEEDETDMKLMSRAASSTRVSQYPDEDKGDFVDPLTGDVLTSSSSESCKEISDHVVEEEEAEDEDQDDLLDADIEVAPTIPTEDEYNLFSDFTQSLLEPTEEKKLENLAFRHEHELRVVVYQLVAQLIEHVVQRSELVEPQNRLRRSLDKEKLIYQLSRVVERYIVEKHINIATLSKITEYLKRVKSTRSLMKLPPDVEYIEKLRYITALKRMDHAKKIAAAAKKNNAYLNSATLMDLQYVQNIAMSTEVDLEVAMRNGILRKDSDFLKRMINREIKLMADMRNEISDTRLSLITRKHTLGRLDERIEHFEQITEDLSMTHFISIQNEVQALDKKLEERNADLKKLHSNYHRELHILAHNKEKTLSFQNKLELIRDELQIKKARQHDLRDKLYKLKLERGVIRRKCNELTYQGGLLAMPTLMFDYDATIKKLKEKRATVQNLRDTFKDISKRVGTVRTTI
ncbi:uncharacterized protein LOC115633387 [Scaptodrosophila lebanonensis]|uniref:Uncharacterized protein LOC115633387 n=1 Tax=Drosophila lebanonensis TaxID=7225 RepID=A0A6J2UEB2_DROLE|nr:uncharacterized protein LOC115633387 [Scaptodrosophila lebanonensis]